MKAKDKSILQQIQERYPGTDPDIDIDWEIGEIFFNEGEKQGRKEVVDWVKDNLTPFTPDGTWDGQPAVVAEMRLVEGEWEAKLKEWGL